MKLLILAAMAAVVICAPDHLQRYNNDLASKIRDELMKKVFHDEFSDKITNACVGKPDGNIPHPYECVYFIKCANEVSNVYNCGNGLHFDPSKDQCVNPEDYPCNL